MFSVDTPTTDIAQNILTKRYLHYGEASWDDVAIRVVNYVLQNCVDVYQKGLTFNLIKNKYFLPNSPCLVNSGKDNGGLCACFVVDFEDNIEGIYKTKLDFALIAKKGGGCGTTLSKLRPENWPVNGSVHGYAGGPIKFYNTISHDMDAMTQAGFRQMAMMGTMSIYHPDIIKFIKAKRELNFLENSNISVMIPDSFMKRVVNNENFTTYFEINGEVVYGDKYNAREVFNLICDSAWENGEPGILFEDRINENTPYYYSNQYIYATNPCGEEPLPPNGVCNLGSLNIAKFLNSDLSIDLISLETAVRLAVNFLDSVVDITSFPTEDIKQWAYNNRAIGLGIMGLADYYLLRGVEYGSDQSLEELEFILNFIYGVANDESILLGKTLGVPDACKNLPHPRRNVTLLSIAPTGTLSLLANCSSGIEPIFSEVTIRTDNTGTYNMIHPLANAPYFKCAVSSNGYNEVTWKEHIAILASAQKFIDAGVSKTINFPQMTKRDTVRKAFMDAWETRIIKGLTIYRNGSRDKEVLSPKNLKRDKCPLCGEDLISESGCKHCSSCDFSLCELG